jgi:hypothetical protein
MSDLHEMAREHQCGGTHYTDKQIQPWDAMECWMTEEQFKGFILGNVIKYMARFQDKGGTGDLEKAKHYLDKLIELW